MIENLKKIMIIIGVLFIALACRLAYIQLYGGTELAAATRSQSLLSLEGSNTRGIIYDRNGAPLVADGKEYVYIIKEDDFTGETAKLLDSLDAEEVNSNNEEYRVYSSEGYDKETAGRLITKSDAYILQASARYGDPQIASHLIGYVNRQDSSGAAGLELMYDDILSGLNRRVYAVADAGGNILPGRGLIVASDDKDDSYISEGIRTTVDKELQTAVENIVSDVDNDCAVVVLDAKTGGVTAMASTPGLDPVEAYKIMQSTGDGLINKATQGEYAPGSVFKIIVTAAALEEGISEEKTYKCTGSVKVGGLEIGCATGGDEGHGVISMEDAFAVSCNSYFVQLGREAGANDIIETAEDFGLGEKVLDGYPQESDGHLMTFGERSGDAIGNLSIGQGETLTTPLQIAAMTGVIAGGGKWKGAHVLMEDEVE